MSVSLVRKVRLRVGAGVAKPGPAIGQALGPLGLNMAEFCKQFNEKTKLYEKDTPIPVDLSAFSNRSFTFVVKSPPTSWFLKKCAGVELGSARFARLRVIVYNNLYHKIWCFRTAPLSNLTLYSHHLKRPGHDLVGTVHVKQIYEIAKIKQADPHMQHLTVETLCKCIAGSAISMGIKVVSGDIPDSKPDKK